MQQTEHDFLLPSRSNPFQQVEFEALFDFNVAGTSMNYGRTKCMRLTNACINSYTFLIGPRYFRVIWQSWMGWNLMLSVLSEIYMYVIYCWLTFHFYAQQWKQLVRNVSNGAALNITMVVCTKELNRYPKKKGPLNFQPLYEKLFPRNKKMKRYYDSIATLYSMQYYRWKGSVEDSE